MGERFQPMGSTSNSQALAKGLKNNSNPEAWRLLGGLMTWFRDKDHVTIRDRIQEKIVEISRYYPIEGPGYYDGRHMTTFWFEIENLKKSENYEKLEELLENMVIATEQDDRKSNEGVIPGFYSELAILNRKQKDYAKEVEILERFMKQNHAPGVMPGQLLDRLEKAKVLKEKKQG